MPVKNCLKEVIQERDNITLNQYKIERDTGLAPTTARNLLKPDYIPGGKTLETVCKSYNLQPGEFLIWIPD